MATTTPNFGWTVPTSSDLVKNGATAIETLGDSIDASLVDLKGGTTGQVLAKASNTDMDFTWATDASGIPATIIDAKGDLIAGTAADTAGRLPVGADDLVLTAASGESTGLKYTGGWTAYTPTRNAITIGNGTETARYCKIGKTVIVQYSLVFGSTTSFGNDPGISPPITPVTKPVGSVLFVDNGVSGSYGQFDYFTSTGIMYFTVGLASGTYVVQNYLTATVPFSWATGDNVTLTTSSEVA